MTMMLHKQINTLLMRGRIFVKIYGRSPGYTPRKPNEGMVKMVQRLYALGGASAIVLAMHDSLHCAYPSMMIGVQGLGTSIVKRGFCVGFETWIPLPWSEQEAIQAEELYSRSKYKRDFELWDDGSFCYATRDPEHDGDVH